MAVASIKVAQVYLKPIDGEDKYGNTHRVSIKDTDDNWYSLGSTKQSTFGQVKLKAGLVTEGTEMDFTYKVNGDFKNINAGSIEMTKEGTPPSNNKGGSKGGSKSGYSGGGFDSVGVAVGAAMNQAVSLVAAKVIKMDKVEDVARDLYTIAETLKAEAHGESKPKKEEKKEEKKETPEPESLDDGLDETDPF